jgi:uncharacterized protein
MVPVVARGAQMTASFARFTAPARHRPELWRLVLGMGVIAACYFGWLAALAGILWLFAGLGRIDAGLRALGTGAEPWAVIGILLTFVGPWIGVWAAVRLLHGRGLGSVFGRAPLVLRDFVAGIAITALVAVAALALLPFAPPLEPATPAAIWLAFLPLALLGLLIQTGAEELVFRGYMQQQLAARFASPIAWMGVPAALFGLAHYAPGAGEVSPWLLVAVTAVFGVIAADLTARSGSIGLAWGLHFANNILAVLIVSAMAGLDGLALFRVREADGGALGLQELLLADVALMALVWALARLWLRHR